MLNKRGKHEILWEKCRREWLKLNPPNHQGYYTCWICEAWVHESEVTLDHILPRSRRPDLRYVLSNLAPAHWICNSEKGSTVLEDRGNNEVDTDEKEPDWLDRMW